MPSATLFIGVLLEEEDVHAVQALMELNLINRPDLEAFVATYADKVLALAARKTFIKQAVAHLANSEKDAREATPRDMGDGPVPEWILKCKASQQRVDFFVPCEETEEIMELVVEYLNDHPDEAATRYAFEDMMDKALAHHLHPIAKVQKDFHDVTKLREPDGTTIYTLAPVANWGDLRADRDARRAARIDIRRHAGERVNNDGAPCTVRLVVKAKQIVDMGGYVLNPGNSTELRDALRFLVKHESLDIATHMPEVAKLSGRYTAVALLSNGARDYVSIMMKNCIGLGTYDSGCTTYAILAPDGEPVVAISVKGGQVDAALGMSNATISGVDDYRGDLVAEFQLSPDAMFSVVECVGGYQRRVDNLQSGDIVEGPVNLTARRITSLPDRLEVRGNLLLSGTPLTKLPSRLRVVGILDIRLTRIAELPEDLKADDLRATRSSVDYSSVLRWLANASTDKVRVNYVSAHCQKHHNELSDKERSAKFDTDILPGIVRTIEAVNLDAPCPPAPQAGRPGRGEYGYWQWLHKVFAQ